MSVPGLRRIDIKATYLCNNHCLFCVQGDKRRIVPEKKRQEIEDILRRSRRRYNDVVFTGGEVTLRGDLVDLVGYAKALGYGVHLQTNGRRLAYRDYALRLMAAGAHAFTVSLHAHKASLHDRLTGSPGSFRQTVEGIRNLLSLNAFIFTNTVVTRTNYRFLSSIAFFLMDLGVRDYRFSFPHILGRAAVNVDAVVPRKTEMVPYLLKGLRAGLEKGCRPSTEAIPLCFLGDLAGCAVEGRPSFREKVFDTHVIEDFNEWRRTEGKTKGTMCRGCARMKDCEGPWREYPQRFGWDEFRPVRSRLVEVP